MIARFRKIIKSKIVRLLLKYVHLIERKNKIILWSVFFITLLGLFFTVQLFRNVRTDFATLLPDNDRSVRQLRYILNRVGGVGTLFVTVSSPDFEANRKVVEAIAAKMKNLPEGLLNDFQYSTDEIQTFYENYGLYYMDISDLEKLRNLLYQRISMVRLTVSGMLLEDSSEKVKTEMEAIFKKYTDKNPYSFFPKGYIGTKDGKILVIMLRPSGTTNDFDFSRRLIDSMNGIIKSVNPASYNDEMEVGLTGAYAGLLENFASVIRDAVSTAGLTIVLVVLAIYFYYRNLRMIFILFCAILSGIAWTFAITYFKIGYLNQQTAFLGSIIIGNGINFGLIQMARYLEERTKGVSVKRSVGRSIINTISATGMAAMTASIAYGILSMTHFRGFSQFGFIGGIGMVLCWLASYIIMPPLLVFFERLKPLDRARLNNRRTHPFSGRISKLVGAYHRYLIYVLIIILPAMVGLTFKYVSHDQFEYQIEKLGNKTASQKGHELYYNAKLYKVIGNTANPAVLLAESREKANEYALLKIKEMKEPRKSGEENTIGEVQWLDGIFPGDQMKKAVIVRQMRQIFPEKYLSLLSGGDLDWGRSAIKLIAAEPFAEADMPPIMLAGFKEKDGTMGRLVYFSAADEVDIANISQLIQFGSDIEKNLPLDSDEARLASQSMIFSDIVKDIAKEGPIITIIAYLLIGVLVFFGSTTIKDFFYVYGFMTLGMLAFIAAMELLDLKLNFFNFVTIPITIGIGVDYGINIYFRYVLEGRGSMAHVIKHTGGAVGLCSLTTMIGYGTMVVADNQSMASFGLMAMIGELVILISAMFFMSSLIEWRDKRQEKGEKSP
ncbi:MAG: MMPL family transporter [Spirochaetia bacterium]|nr:MMPL family transporter [Spirochaetia bacterium]